MKHADLCIICLSEKKNTPLINLCDTVTSEGRGCTCNPAIHRRCLTQWYRTSGKKCPGCLEPYYVYPVIPEPNDLNPRMKYAIAGLIGASLLTPFLILALQAYFPNP